MNEELYIAWAKAEWAQNSVREACSKMEQTLDDLYDLTDFLEEKLMADSDSADMQEAIPKYEALLKLSKTNVAEA